MAGVTAALFAASAVLAVSAPASASQPVALRAHVSGLAAAGPPPARPRTRPPPTRPPGPTSATAPPTTVAPIQSQIPPPVSTLPLETKAQNAHVNPLFAYLSGIGFAVALLIMLTQYVLPRAGRRGHRTL